MRRPRRGALPILPLAALWPLATLLGTTASPLRLAAQAPDSVGWRREAVGQLNLTQVTLDNWSQGGENALAWQVTMASKFEYRQPTHSWTTSGKLGYGRSKLGDSDFRKSIDEIRIESVFTRRAPGFLDPYVSATALTQFSTGYQYTDTTRTATSDFFDPAYFTQSVGLGYQPSETFRTRAGAAVKETITSAYNLYADDPDTPGVEKTKVEAGANSVTDVNATFQSNVLVTSKLELFSDLSAFDRIDVSWETALTVQVSRYINVNLNVSVLYDRDVSTRRQVKESLAVGLTYAFLRG